MKKFVVVVTMLISMVCLLLVGCQNDNQSSDPVVIVIDEEVETITLKEHMDKLVEEGELTYSISDGMVTSINGKSNTTNSYWMLYTNDTVNSNSNWGTYEYKGKVFASASSGADQLGISKGFTYIWVYQSF